MKYFREKRQTRSQTTSDTEHIELSRNNAEHSPHSILGLSPLNPDSEYDSHDCIHSEASDQSQDIELSESCTRNETNLSKFDDGIDSELIYDHLSKHPETQVQNIRCSESECAVTIKSVGVEIGIYRFLYCEQCDKYVCSKCRYPDHSSRPCGDSEDTITHSEVCKYPEHFIT